MAVRGYFARGRDARAGRLVVADVSDPRPPARAARRRLATTSVIAEFEVLAGRHPRCGARDLGQADAGDPPRAPPDRASPPRCVRAQPRRQREPLAMNTATVYELNAQRLRPAPRSCSGASRLAIDACAAHAASPRPPPAWPPPPPPRCVRCATSTPPATTHRGLARPRLLVAPAAARPGPATVATSAAPTPGDERSPAHDHRPSPRRSCTVRRGRRAEVPAQCAQLAPGCVASAAARVARRPGHLDGARVTHVS